MTSLLLLTQPLSRGLVEYPNILEAAAKYCGKRLYIHWDLFPREPIYNEPFHGYHSSIVSSIYKISSVVIPKIDVRIILNGFKCFPKWEHSLNFDNILIDHQNVEYLKDIEEKYSIVFNQTRPVFLLDNFCSGFDKSLSKYLISDVVDEVVIGGTFDQIHTGHKILLSESVMRTKKRLTIGIADGPLLEKKILKDLIKPVDDRMEKLKEFLIEIDSSIEYNLVPIIEPMGPTSWDTNLELIVVSEETESAVDYINKYRSNKGINMLKKHVVQLAEDTLRLEGEEIKHSSSSIRRRMLGSRLNDVKVNTKIPISPYIIGLTGGSASGKSGVASYLMHLGAGIIDCDVLGHRAYMKGSLCANNLIDSFGTCILDKSGEIDRRKLGSKVFQDVDKLKLLNSIVWPEIKTLMEEEIHTLKKNGVDVIVLDAAILVNAGWNEFCHETWVCLVSKEEAVKRIMKRDNKSKEEAENRIAHQMTNKDMLKYANIAFCSEYDFSFTKSQVYKSWNILKSEGKISLSKANL